MKAIQDFLRRLWLFNKRLLKKPGFLAILLLAPLLVTVFTFISRTEDSGIITVAVAAVNPEDPLAKEVVTELTEGASLIRFIPCATVKDASQLVERAEADAAWIFPDDMQARLDEFVNRVADRNAFVTVIQREDNVFLNLSHEKLTALLFSHCSRSMYRDYIRDNLVELDDLSDEQLFEFYDTIDVNVEDLFTFSYADSAVPESTGNINYLLSPLRGLAAVLMLIGGLAVALFYSQDSLDGKFDASTPSERPWLCLGYHLAAVLDLTVVVFATVLIAGLQTTLLREILAILLYAVITVGFCITLRLICRDIRLLGALIPIVAIMCIVLCPVFFHLASIPVVQFLLPPFYYLNAINDGRFLYYMVAYAFIILGIDLLLYRIRQK